MLSRLQRALAYFAMTLPVPAISIEEMLLPEGNDAFNDGQRVRWKLEVWNAAINHAKHLDPHNANYINGVGRSFHVKKDYLGRLHPDTKYFDATIVDPNAIEAILYPAN